MASAARTGTPVARRSAGLLAVVTAVASLAACSSGKHSSARTSASTSTSASRTATATTCRPPTPATPVPAAPVPGVASDRNLTSFDGATIRIHWFPTTATGGRPAPTVLMGPGWGQAGDTNTGSVALFGFVTIHDLNGAGYNVLTWDPRGFGKSSGTVEVDSPAFEGRDVQRMIDWVAAQPGVELDAQRDPRVGMIGASYGGGIQLATAPIDCRVDAIVPSWAWHSLTTSLAKSGVYKQGWATLLSRVSVGHQLDPHIADGQRYAEAHGTVDPADAQWFEQRGPGDAVARIRIPTLFVQGESDNLFTLDEAVTNYGLVKRNGVPVAMLWTCGGHGVCLTNRGDPNAVKQETLAWLARYLGRDAHAPSVPGFAFVDQNGASYTATRYPLPAGAPLVGDGHGTLALQASGGSGPARLPAGRRDAVGTVAAPVTPAKATNALDVSVDAGSRAALAIGAPQLRLTYRGTVPPGDRPTAVFAQLVDDATGIVLGNQITPVPLVLDGRTHTTSVPMEIVVFAAKPGAHLTLQLVATTVAYAQPRLGGSVELSAVHVELPVAAGIAPR